MQRFAAIALCVAVAGQVHAQTEGTSGRVRTQATEAVPATPLAPPSQPPPRLNGRTFTSAVVDAAGVHQLQVRIKDGVAVTSIDGHVVPAHQVRLLKGGKLQILEPDGAVRFNVQLPRGSTRVREGVKESAATARGGAATGAPAAVHTGTTAPAAVPTPTAARSPDTSIASAGGTQHQSADSRPGAVGPSRGAAILVAMGMTLQPAAVPAGLAPGTELPALLVAEVDPSGPAARAGLRPGDLLVEAARPPGAPAAGITPHQLAALATEGAGRAVTLEFLRGVAVESGTVSGRPLERRRCLIACPPVR